MAMGSVKRYLPSGVLHSVVVGMVLVATYLFATWWFEPGHVPDNFSSWWHILDYLIFLLVSYVIWLPIVMEVLTWAISLQVSEESYRVPVQGMRVAFITTIVPAQESVELLHRVLPAMARVDYPHDNWLLDEGNSPEVKAICRRYGVRHFSRLGSQNLNTATGKFTKTKGGNHNSWYETNGSAYDFVAQIDTDFVPDPDFLVRTLGYFRDPKVAFVGTPQVYGNTGQSLVARGAAEQLYNFYGPVLQGLSGIGMPLMIGANHVVRVAALTEVDHYTAHITEDLITGMKLHADGWQSVYVPQTLAVGEGPLTWEAYFTQQMRWAYGCFDILFHHSAGYLKKMSWRWRVHYFFLMQHYFTGLAMAMSVGLLTLYFAFGIRASNVDPVKFLVIYSFVILSIWLASLWLQRFHITWKNESHLYAAGTIINIAAWPIYFLAFVTALLGRRLTYKVTPKGQEDDGPSKIPIRLFIPHLVFGSIAAVGFASSFATHRQSPIMLFWAVSSALVLLSLPLVETIATGLTRLEARLHTIGTRLYSLVTDLSATSGSGSGGARRARPATAPVAAPAAIWSRAWWAYHMTGEDVAEKLADCGFLSLVVMASCAMYVGRLGFYSDDWAFLGNFSTAANTSLAGLIRIATTPNTLMRPMQNVYDAALYFAFGLHPLGYQLVNSGVFCGVVVMFYLVLRRLRLPRAMAVAVAAVFAMLPNYSTDRFWYAAFQVNLSLALYLASLYCGLRAVDRRTKRVMSWKAVSLMSLVLSILSYEVVLPLAIVNLALYLRPFGRSGAGEARKRPSQAVFVAINIVVVAYLVVFKAVTTTRLGQLNFPGDALGIMKLTIATNFGVWGIDMPRIWAENLTRYASPQSIAAAAGLGLAVGGYVFWMLAGNSKVLPPRWYLRNLVLWGAGVFVCGYAIFFVNNKVGFSPTGIDNRVAIAAALGIACMCVGGLGWVCRLIPNVQWSRLVFCAGIATVCSGGYLTLSTMASYWAEASMRQQAILTDMRTDLPMLASGSTVFLDGVCPYAGPGIVFESQWDLAGAMEVYYHNADLRADVVTPRLKVKADAIYTQIYTFPARYPYVYPTYMYNFKDRGVYLIRDATSANDYFATFDPDHNNGCPPAVAGNGVSIF